MFGLRASVFSFGAGLPGKEADLLSALFGRDGTIGCRFAGDGKMGKLPAWPDQKLRQLSKKCSKKNLSVTSQGMKNKSWGNRFLARDNIFEEYTIFFI
jgi:hypothetical protein